MGKYIIDVDDKYVSPDNELIVSHKNLFDGCSYHIQIAKLAPYIEPDIREAYRRGLNDAWEAARKIMLAPEDGGMDGSKVDEIFRVAHYRDALKYYSAFEAIEMIRAYEWEQENETEIRDILNTTMKERNVTIDKIAEVLQKMRETE